MCPSNVVVVVLMVVVVVVLMDCYHLICHLDFCPFWGPFKGPKRDKNRDDKRDDRPNFGPFQCTLVGRNWFLS